MINKFDKWLNEKNYTNLLTKEDLEWCEKYLLKGWTINSNRKIYCNNISKSAGKRKYISFKNASNITEFPLKFADVEKFNCTGVHRLESLKNSPDKCKEFEIMFAKKLPDLKFISKSICN